MLKHFPEVMEGFREVYKLKLPDCDLGDVYDQKYLLLEIVNSEKKKRTWIVRKCVVVDCVDVFAGSKWKKTLSFWYLC